MQKWERREEWGEASEVVERVVGRDLTVVWGSGPVRVVNIM